VKINRSILSVCLSLFILAVFPIYSSADSGLNLTNTETSLLFDSRPAIASIEPVVFEEFKLINIHSNIDGPALEVLFTDVEFERTMFMKKDSGASDNTTADYVFNYKPNPGWRT